MEIIVAGGWHIHTHTREVHYVHVGFNFLVSTEGLPNYSASPQLEDSFLRLSAKLGSSLGAGRGAVKPDPEKVASGLTGTRV